MKQTISVTRQWQIHIPVNIRKALKWEKPEMADVSVINDTLVIKPKKSPVMKLAGKYHEYAKNLPVPLERIRDVIDYSDL